MKFPAGLNVPLAWQCVVPFPHYVFAQDLLVVRTSAVSAQVLAPAPLPWVALRFRLPHRCPVPLDTPQQRPVLSRHPAPVCHQWESAIAPADIIHIRPPEAQVCPHLHQLFLCLGRSCRKATSLLLQKPLCVFFPCAQSFLCGAPLSFLLPPSALSLCH